MASDVGHRVIVLLPSGSHRGAERVRSLGAHNRCTARSSREMLQSGSVVPGYVSEPEESLAEFKDSFFYGRRSDPNVEFLADLSTDEAGEFVAEMLGLVGGVIDDGDVEPLVGRFVEWQRRAFADHLDRTAKFAYDDAAFTRLARPLSESLVALITSSGHFVDGDDPQPFWEPAMTQAEAEVRITEFLRAEPTLSTIPVDVAPEGLRVRHGGYPIAPVLADHQVALPLDHLRTAERHGLIGELAPSAYSFVGAASQLGLRDKVVAVWAEMLHAAEVEVEVEVVLLVPVWPVCHVSVGRVQRVLEAGGIPTVGIYLAASAHVPREMCVARALITPNPLGRPLDAPHDGELQREVVEAALALFDVDAPTIRHHTKPYRPAPGPR